MFKSLFLRSVSLNHVVATFRIFRILTSLFHLPFRNYQKSRRHLPVHQAATSKSLGSPFSKLVEMGNFANLSNFLLMVCCHRYTKYLINQKIYCLSEVFWVEIRLGTPFIINSLVLKYLLADSPEAIRLSNLRQESQ